MKFRCALPPLTALCLTSCLLTEMLWDSGPPKPPQYRRITAQCAVLEARGQIAASPDQTRIDLLLATPSDNGLPHVDAWTEESPGRLVLRPSLFEPDWLFAASDQIEPQAWDVATFGGDDFSRVQPGFNARVSIWGTTDPTVFGRIVEAPDAPTAALQPTLFGPRWERDAFASLNDHEWAKLLGQGGGHTARPLAWIDRIGQRNLAVPRESRPTEFELLVRFVDGRGEDLGYALIPAAILAGTFGQQLERIGNRIAWRYSAVWRARHMEATELPLFELPRLSNLLAYEWDRRLPQHGEKALTTLTRIALTPVAVALDIAIATHPGLRRFVAWLFGVEPPVGSGQSSN